MIIITKKKKKTKVKVKETDPSWSQNWLLGVLSISGLLWVPSGGGALKRVLAPTIHVLFWDP